MTPSSLNTGFRPAELLRAWCPGARPRRRRAPGRPAARPGRSGRPSRPSSVAAASLSCEAAGELVELVAGQAPLLRHHLGADALVEGDAVALAHLRAARAAEVLEHGRSPRAAPRLIDLDAARDDHVVLAGDQPGRGEVDGLLGRAALAVHGGARHRLRPARGQHGDRGPTLPACWPTCCTQPQITSSTTAGSKPFRATSAFSTWADRSTAWTAASAPFRLPTGVRTASTMTASRADMQTSRA